MITTPPVENQSQNQSAAPESGFEIAVQEFWQKNRSLILGLCVIALLAIVGREGWQYFAAQHEQASARTMPRRATGPSS
ncbi:MAG: tetratricopeptide repeat protein [Lacunisphaera sp.]